MAVSAGSAVSLNQISLRRRRGDFESGSLIGQIFMEARGSYENQGGESGGETIAGSAHRQDVFRKLGILLQLLPQQSNVHIDCSSRDIGLVFPNFRQQLIAE